MRPAWAEISLDRLIQNYRLLSAAAGESGLIAVVKANAYGHGTLACAHALANAGAAWLGVTNAEEAIAVRATCPGARILVMSGLWEHEAEGAIEHRLTPVVWEPAHLEWLDAATREKQCATQSVAVHLEIDTGMARQGVRLADLPSFLERMQAAKALSLEGVMTHFHSPELLDGEATAAQMARLDAAMEIISARGFRPTVIHAGNSATVLANDGARSIGELAAKYGASAMLRPGLSLYGYPPRVSGEGASTEANELQPVLAWKTRVVSLRTIEAGESAGYNATFRAGRPSRLALLPVGYADGMNRLLSNRGEVLVRGQRAPIVGRISMDLTIVDVTDIPAVEMGDEVVLIGKQGTEQISAYDFADLAGTIPYEVLCNISARVRRVTLNASEDDV
ncbi:alanine racemase [Silvibacterium bohemicum]|uniref:Alanine racemase n=1 Tax=Silvibacterium bohemicum TaxID=1577686 RepID=A0A841K655_9BACT|nr:alanine racemase [Silvibacterium bohemicum]MBB6145744.1 alanine racemase [Silvibacterium bohemicum]